jgi:hypothetical protein
MTDDNQQQQSDLAQQALDQAQAAQDEIAALFADWTAADPTRNLPADASPDQIIQQSWNQASGGGRTGSSSGGGSDDSSDDAGGGGNADGGGSAAEMGGQAYTLSGHAGSSQRGQGGAPPAYTAGDQPGSNPNTSNNGVTGESVAESAMLMIGGGPIGLFLGLESLFGNSSDQLPNLTRYAMPDSMEFEGTTTGGTGEDSFSSTAQPRAAEEPAAAATSSTTAPAAPAAPLTDEEWIGNNASTIATAVQTQLLNCHPLMDTINSLT